MLRAFRKSGWDRALVFDNNELKGIVTVKDVLFKVASSKRKRFIPSALHVSSVMSSPVVTLPQITPIVKAFRVMLERNISSIPATEGNRVIALFTKWDVTKVLKNDTKPLNDLTSLRSSTYLHENDSLVKARKAMLKEDTIFLPVVNSEGKLVGILTASDLLSSLAEICNFLSNTGAKNALSNITVSEIMRPIVPILHPSTSIGEVASIIEKRRTGGILIMDKDKLLGVITLTDLVRYVVHQ